ncbi:hypothetical protein KP509_10G031700 [Ceratopteris richardii]|uniref:ELK domain-containing protein n=1 Tax=Ceratopteris richardii TaxID=49495 RepID=A0A8T2TXL7_CERRI|nr:hypothetical protein KP509_10G031700 [Ceratopteris richardii]
MASNDDVLGEDQQLDNVDMKMEEGRTSVLKESLQDARNDRDTPFASLEVTGATGTRNKTDDLRNNGNLCPLPSARLKWCGCLASLPCSHYTNNYSRPPQHILSAAQNPHLNWLPSSSTYIHSGSNKHPDVNLHPFQLQYLASQHDQRQLSRLKAQILAHPMYDQLLAAHVACLRVATPVDNLESIDTQLTANVPFVLARYKAFLGDDEQMQSLEERTELDQFMANYIVFLRSFREQLHDHVRVQAMDAVMSCWEIEKAFVNITGVTPEEAGGDTIWEGDDREYEWEGTAGASHYQSNMLLLGSADYLEGIDILGLGPLLPTESERSLMERVRLELKSELKQGYKNRIADVREEILRKRRAGKLPPETTALLKKWWNAHSKWPYPTIGKRLEDKIKVLPEWSVDGTQLLLS